MGAGMFLKEVCGGKYQNINIFGRDISTEAYFPTYRPLLHLIREPLGTHYNGTGLLTKLKSNICYLRNTFIDKIFLFLCIFGLYLVDLIHILFLNGTDE